MTLIKSTVGSLPYKLLDFDQHSYEADDCFTRYMPKDKLDTAIYPVRTASGRKATPQAYTHLGVRGARPSQERLL